MIRWISRAIEREKPPWVRRFGVSLDPVRSVALPAGAVIVGVGGATFGGSGRTPLAIAIAGALQQHVGSVAFVAHGYGARTPLAAARVVRRDEDAREVGDETVIAAQQLDVPVIVGPRAEALALAARTASIVVVDRLLQTRPEPLSCSILAIDPHTPWGSGARAPFGDLLATPEALVRLSDEVVAVGGTLAPARFELSRSTAGLRVGAIASMARPARMKCALAGLGVTPRVFLDRADHAAFTARELRRIDLLGKRERIDAWIVDAKTAALLPEARRSAAISLSQLITVTPELLARICAHAKLANGERRC